MRVDSTRIRRDARRDYDRARRALERAQAELVAFEKQDMPQFREWMHATFGTILTELREMSQRMNACQEELEDIEIAAGFWGCSLRSAWLRLERGEQPVFADDPARGEPSPEGDDPFVEGDEDGSPFDDGGGHEFGEDEAEFCKRFMGFDPRTESAPGRRRGGSRAAAPEDRQARDVYRQIARRVHPDTHGREPSPGTKAIWYEAQDAYRTRDVARLELLLFRLDLEAGAQQPGQVQISLLRQLTNRLKRSLGDVRRELRRHQQDPAWGFSRVKDRSHLAGSIEYVLRRDRDTLRRELRGLEIELNRIRRPASPGTRADRRPRPATPGDAGQPDLPF